MACLKEGAEMGIGVRCLDMWCSMGGSGYLDYLYDTLGSPFTSIFAVILNLYIHI